MPEYVVLKNRQIALIDSDHVRGSSIQAEALIQTWVPILNQVAEEGPDGHVRRVEAEGPDEAIDLVAGVDGDELKPGTYKAISWRNWAGSVTLKPKAAVDRTRSVEE